MAKLTARIEIEFDDVLVHGLPSARENIEYFTESAIRNRLFGHGFLPDDIEVDGWSIRFQWHARAGSADGQPSSRTGE